MRIETLKMAGVVSGVVFGIVGFTMTLELFEKCGGINGLRTFYCGNSCIIFKFTDNCVSDKFWLLHNMAQFAESELYAKQDRVEYISAALLQMFDNNFTPNLLPAAVAILKKKIKNFSSIANNFNRVVNLPRDSILCKFKVDFTWEEGQCDWRRTLRRLRLCGEINYYNSCMRTNQGSFDHLRLRLLLCIWKKFTARSIKAGSKHLSIYARRGIKKWCYPYLLSKLIGFPVPSAPSSSRLVIFSDTSGCWPPQSPIQISNSVIRRIDETITRREQRKHRWRRIEATAFKPPPPLIITADIWIRIHPMLDINNTLEGYTFETAKYYHHPHQKWKDFCGTGDQKDSNHFMHEINNLILRKVKKVLTSSPIKLEKHKYPGLKILSLNLVDTNNKPVIIACDNLLKNEEMLAKEIREKDIMNHMNKWRETMMKKRTMKALRIWFETTATAAIKSSNALMASWKKRTVEREKEEKKFIKVWEDRREYNKRQAIKRSRAALEEKTNRKNILVFWTLWAVSFITMWFGPVILGWSVLLGGFYCCCSFGWIGTSAEKIPLKRLSQKEISIAGRVKKRRRSKKDTSVNI